MNRSKSTAYHGWGTQPAPQPLTDLQSYINRISRIRARAEDTAIYTLLERNGIDLTLLQGAFEGWAIGLLCGILRYLNIHIHHHAFADHETFILFKNNHPIDHISVNKPELLN